MPVQPPQSGDQAAAPAPVRDHRSRLLRWAAAAAVVGALMVYNNLNPSGGDSAVGAPAPAAAGDADHAGVTPAVPITGLALPRSTPTRITIPAIGVNAPFTALSLGADGVLQPPPESNANLAGWYADGPTPGERGPAIVAGHVDTKTGPAVFFLLSLVKPGETAVITRGDGSTATFTVDRVRTFSKGSFPDKEVYGDTPDAELRIITCGGSFDRKKQDYKANTVVFAHLASVKRA